jgi:hypothetical protein
MRGKPRFKMVTVEGHLAPIEGRSSKRPGVTAHVLDTLYCHNVVDTFRSEDYQQLPTPIAKAAVIMFAQVKCEALNIAA